MPVGQIALTVSCVLIIALGQVLFKYVGLSLQGGSSPFDSRIVVLTAFAMLVYAVASLLWILLLRTVPLSRAYPFMALAFLVVPALSALFFDETMTGWYYIGTALIVSGVVVISVSG